MFGTEVLQMRLKIFFMYNPARASVKARFCQKIIMFLSKLQTDEHFSFLKLKIWILATENCLEIEDVLKLESLVRARRPAWAGLGSLKNRQNSNYLFQERKMFDCLEL